MSPPGSLNVELGEPGETMNADLAETRLQLRYAS